MSRNQDYQQKLDDYKDLRKKLRLEIKQSKANSSQDLCKQVEVDS